VLTAVPVALGALALAILALDQVADVPPAGGLLAVGAVAAALVRGAMAFREYAAMVRRAGSEARTDALSGLGNRRALLHDLDLACNDGRAHTLAFFDLDGFKGYNDVFGHGAGDDLLSLLAADLRVAVGDLGRAYRLGGDEFCVLAAGELHDGDPRMRAVRDALTHATGDMAIAASVGVVQVPAEADAPGAALQLADERMYADKGRRRAVAL
jgi:diguanylate cyclase (GGDEF)-like protein